MRFTNSLIAAAAAVSFPVHADYITASVPGDSFEIDSTSTIEARFKADTTNWDLRLATNGTPVPGDNQGHLANGRSNFESRGFDFALTYDAAIDTFQWSVDSETGASRTLSLAGTGLSEANAFHLFTSGSRASVTVTDLLFTGFGESIADFAEIDTSPTGTTFRQGYLVLPGEDLTASDWSLTGSLVFDDFTRSNPNEGAKINIRVAHAAVVPAPATALLIVTPLAFRRRR